MRVTDPVDEPSISVDEPSISPVSSTSTATETDHIYRIDLDRFAPGTPITLELHKDGDLVATVLVCTPIPGKTSHGKPYASSSSRGHPAPDQPASGSIITPAVT